VFSDRTDIYFARQQVTERLNDAKPALPPGVDIKMGPISTGLGEVYWWTVEYAQPGDDARDGAPGWQSDGSYLTPEGEHLADELSRLVYLRTVQDWIIRPQLKTVRGVAGADAIGGIKQYRVIRRGKARWIRLVHGQLVCDEANAAAPTTSSASARAMWCAPAGASRIAEIGTLSSPPEVTS
jgi:Cu/Ag efflux pump CusA